MCVIIRFPGTEKAKAISPETAPSHSLPQRPRPLARSLFPKAGGAGLGRLSFLFPSHPLTQGEPTDFTNALIPLLFTLPQWGKGRALPPSRSKGKGQLPGGSWESCASLEGTSLGKS